MLQQKIVLSCRSSCCPELTVDNDRVLLTNDDGTTIVMSHPDWLQKMQAFKSFPSDIAVISVEGKSISLTAEQMDKAIDFYQSKMSDAPTTIES